MIFQAGVATELELARGLNAARKEFKMAPRKSELLQVYLGLVSRGELPVSEGLRKALVKKASKSKSGVLVITVLTSPHPEYTDPDSGRRVRQAFSCEWNCYYCPDEPGQPRSYLHDEPSVLRANMNQFDPVLQFANRAATLAQNGHPVDKVTQRAHVGSRSHLQHRKPWFLVWRGTICLTCSHM